MRNRFYKNIPGWFSDAEANILYNLCLNINGSILEIGTLYGKSTSVICEAISDSFTTPIFDSCDMNFETREEFMTFYTKVHGGIEIPDLIEKLSFSINKNIFDVTREYLSQFDLLKFVNLIPGNFNHLNKKYDVIFCDAMHDINEFNLNLPHLFRLSNPRCVWAIHDFNCIEKYMLPILDENKITRIDVIDSLGIFKL
jgi:predicted O-methyltransferase YrrM